MTSVAYWCEKKNSYRLNAIVDDDTANANCTIFERVAQDLIRVHAQKLALF